MLLWLSSLTFHAIIIISISLNCFIANIFFSHGVWSFFCGNFIVNLITRLPYIFHIRARHINFRWLFCVGIEVKWKMFKELSWRFVFRGLWNYLMAFRNIKLKGRGIFMKCHCRKFIMHNNTWRFSFRSSLIHFSMLKRTNFALKRTKKFLNWHEKSLTWI